MIDIIYQSAISIMQCFAIFNQPGFISPFSFIIKARTRASGIFEISTRKDI